MRTLDMWCLLGQLPAAGLAPSLEKRRTGLSLHKRSCDGWNPERRSAPRVQPQVAPHPSGRLASGLFRFGTRHSSKRTNLCLGRGVSGQAERAVQGLESIAAGLPGENVLGTRRRNARECASRVRPIVCVALEVFLPSCVPALSLEACLAPTMSLVTPDVITPCSLERPSFLRPAWR
jgi:hypothetical protein